MISGSVALSLVLAVLLLSPGAVAVAPPLAVDAPDVAWTNDAHVLIVGATCANCTATIGGVGAPVNGTGAFSRDVPLKVGPNVIEIRVVAPEGNGTSVNLTITREPAIEGPPLTLDLTMTLVVIALAVGTIAGYVYGRLRTKPVSAPKGAPANSPLTTQSHQTTSRDGEE